tara:strand:- start:887 stop:1066 length:180 start_codon:yes stop_codon:yes gene_type:complete
MKYALYDQKANLQGTFVSLEELRAFLGDLKYEMKCDRDFHDTFDYINSIGWRFDIIQSQ